MSITNRHEHVLIKAITANFSATCKIIVASKYTYTLYMLKANIYPYKSTYRLLSINCNTTKYLISFIEPIGSVRCVV